MNNYSTVKAGSLIKAYVRINKQRTYLNGNLSIVSGLPSTDTITRLGRDDTLQSLIRLGVDLSTLSVIVGNVYPKATGEPWLPDLTAFLASSVRHYLTLAAAEGKDTTLPATLSYATLDALSGKYIQHAKGWYAGDSDERRHIETVLHLLTSCYGKLTADKISTVQLKQVRQCLIDGGWLLPSGLTAGPWSRNTINSAMRRVHRCFRWGVEHGMVPAATLAQLDSMRPLARGRSQAEEHGPVKPVPWPDVAKTIPYLLTPLQSAVNVQWLSGCRPGEVVRMCAADLDSSTADQGVWLWKLDQHKTANRGETHVTKIIVLGPRALEYVRPLVTRAETPTDPLFPTPEGGFYSTTSYRTAIGRAAERAGVPHWHPHQMRHGRAEQIDGAMGREAAAAVLGDTLDVAAVYTSRNMRLAADVARKMG